MVLVVFVMDTMIEDRKLKVVRSQCGFDLGLCFRNISNSGGMGFRRRHRDVDLVSFSTHHILVKIMDADGIHHWFACGVHGWAE